MHPKGGSDNYRNRWVRLSEIVTPFYFSALEQDFSRRNSSNFFLYRVFNLKADPKLFIANGAYDEFCNANPTQFKGTF